MLPGCNKYDSSSIINRGLGLSCGYSLFEVLVAFVSVEYCDKLDFFDVVDCSEVFASSASLFHFVFEKGPPVDLNVIRI